MKRVLDFVRQNLLVCTISALSLSIYGYLTLSGKECFNCKRTEIYKTGQQRGNTYLRFRHK